MRILSAIAAAHRSASVDEQRRLTLKNTDTSLHVSGNQYL